MDDWKNNQQDAYTGITAQRRNRRRTGAAPETPDTDRRTPEAFRGTDGAFRETARTDRGTDEALRETTKTDRGTDGTLPGTTEKPAEPHEPDTEAKLKQSTAAEETAESDMARTGGYAPVRETEPENQESSGKDEEPPAAVQGADSRVPPEARRMAASPYGGMNPAAKRPGTRPQTAQRRPVQPEDRRPVRPENRRPVQPEERRPGIRQTGGTGTEMPEISSGRLPEYAQKTRLQVGYAPGRMSEEMTRHIPTGDAGREAQYTREAKAYLEKRKQPFRTENTGKKEPDRPGNKVLRVFVAVLVLAGLVLTGMLFLKNRDKTDKQKPQEGPQADSFIQLEKDAVLIAPADLGFQAVTGKDVEDVRLSVGKDEEPETQAKAIDNGDQRLWTLKMHLDTGFSGTVMLQARRSGEEKWYDTGKTVQVEVSGPTVPADNIQQSGGNPAAADPEKDNGIAGPDDEDYYNEDEERAEAAEPEEQSGKETVGEGLPEEPEGDPAEDTAEEPGNPEEEENPDDPEEDPDDPDFPAEDADSPREGEEELPVGELKTAEPTPTPALETPEPTATPPLTAEAAPEANPDLITGTTVWTSATKKEKAYSRPAKELIHMPPADEYTKKQLGVMTFRGDNFRRNAAVGTLSAEPKALEVLWQTESGSSRGTNQTYYGYQWTGQPVIARWSTEVRARSNITDTKIEKKALKEVIIAGMDGSIRFLDLEDGKATRNSIRLGYPMRGTPSLHTRGYPFLSVGQFARKMKTKTGKIGLRQYNLYTQGELKLIDGLDGKYHRPLNDIGSFETSALIDRESDTLIIAGTNGMLYLESLGSTFDFNTGVMTISPSVTAMSSKAKGQKSMTLTAVESSLAAYDKYVFYADMGGVLRCVDTNTLTAVWAAETGDSVMAAVAMDLTESRELNLYTANMLNNRKKGTNIQIRRYDALSGHEDWCTDIGVYKGKKDKDDVGAKASPVIGQHGLNDLVYFTVTGLSDEGREQLRLGGEEPAALIALEKDTGRIVWAFGLSSRSESSPIALYNDEGRGWIFQCEQNGTIHLLDGLTGTEVSSLQLQAEIEASPAAYNNVVVIGTTGKGTSYVYGIRVSMEETGKGGDGE